MHGGIGVMNKIEETLFKEGLREGNLLKLREVSKVDVHNHCGLGMRFSTFNKWAGGQVNEPPKKIEGILGIDDYILGETIKFISKAEDIIFLIDSTVREAIGDGVKVLESSLDCHNLIYFDNKDEFFEGIVNIKTNIVNI
jgi:adenosine deaminase